MIWEGFCWMGSESLFKVRIGGDLRYCEEGGVNDEVANSILHNSYSIICNRLWSHS